ETEPGAASRLLGREERMEDPVAQLLRNADAVVANVDLDLVAEIAGRDANQRLVSRNVQQRLLSDGIAGVVRQAQENAAEVLGNQFHRADVRVVVGLDGDFNCLVLRSQALNGKIDLLAHESVQVGGTPFAGLAAGMRERRLESSVGPSGIF